MANEVYEGFRLCFYCVQGIYIARSLYNIRLQFCGVSGTRGWPVPTEKVSKFRRVELEIYSTLEGNAEVKCRLTPAPFGADVKSQLS
jgi:hypothetical protein